MHSRHISENYELPAVRTVQSLNDHTYETVHPLSPYIEPEQNDEDGYIEDPYFLYDDLGHSKMDKSCDCNGACNCATYE